MIRESVIKVLDKLMCPHCGNNGLRQEKESLFCISCQETITTNSHGQVIFTENFIDQSAWENESEDFNLFGGKIRPVKSTKISGPRISELIDMLSVQGIAINLGSGQDKHEGYINVDLGNYAPVDIVADLRKIPFCTGSVELVASNSVLEHIYDYEKVVVEAARILKQGGYFYLCVPNVCLRHHKLDYHRWTSMGLSKLLEGKFEIVDSGPCRGAAYTLTILVDALIANKITNRILSGCLRAIWSVVSKPLFWMNDEKSEEYQALSQTIYVLAKRI